MSFATGTVVDARDGKIYKTVLMPDGKWWLSENLAWVGAGVDGNNNPANRAIYGRLYTWDEAATLAAFPGSHLPTLSDYVALDNSIPGDTTKAMKAISVLWSPDTGTDAYGFSALPGGKYRQSKNQFEYIGTYFWAWSSTLNADTRFGEPVFFSATASGITYVRDYRENKMSVRLIVDSGNIPDPTECFPVTYSPPAGIYGATQTVTLFTETAGADIYYTVDGSEPTSGSTLYTTSLTISETTTVKAIAVKAGLDDSAVTSALYIIMLPVPPSIYPPSGTLQGVQIVVIQGPGTIRYTLDGSEPTASSPIYTRPFRLSASTTVKAKAFVNPLESLTATAALDIQGAKPEAIPSYKDRIIPLLLEQYRGDNAA